jgi:hypothetical protein
VVIEVDFSQTAALGANADIYRGGMAAFTQSGHSEDRKSAKSNVGYRPKAVAETAIQIKRLRL